MPQVPGSVSRVNGRGCVVVSIFGLSTQDTDYQKEAVERLELPYPVLSDRELFFVRALSCQTFNLIPGR